MMDPRGDQMRIGNPGEQAAGIGDGYGAGNEPARTSGIVRLGSHGTHCTVGPRAPSPPGRPCQAGPAGSARGA